MRSEHSAERTAAADPLARLEAKTSAYLRSRAARRSKEVLGLTLHYTVLLSLSFVFIYPILYIVSQSFMQVEDITDATVQWIPKALSFEHYRFAFNKMDYWHSFGNSAVSTLLSAAAQIFSCAVVGYGFARYRFPGHSLLLALVLFAFLVPPQTIVIPLFIFFGELHWLNTSMPIIVPGLFAQGLRGALFVLIFMQFFRGLPHQLEEAARIDGAGAYRTYFQIMLPLSGPALLVVFLFSTVWHWNDVFEPNLYYMVQEFYNLPQQLAILDTEGVFRVQQAKMMTGGRTLGSVPTNFNRNMAGALITILPLILLYGFAQRYFIESVERTGIAGD
ncbi:carbohydrate ABC transporter permease [Paenibacillus antri]|uniref:Carbohydrate ABC transporter permease n=1 Tax=Paenibacillus antri TaxID=2582848 RepID=A0A5R9GGZ6_9BACL|nr:carbohydrate ABC transporter permease [Paenibacillus antri]TLS52614.1 carbohydrate ABC transporter permease [Paenibacillus antri]